MKKNRKLLVVLFMLMILFTGTAVPSVKTSAASLTNVLKAPKAKAGKWVYAQNGKRYRFTASGNYAKKRWLKISGKIYYFTSDGYVKKGLFTYNSRKYYLDSNGRLVTGWKTISGKKYYFWKSSSKGKLAGSAAVGKVSISNKYYYFDKNGVRQTGWIKIGKDYYYFKPTSGDMAKNTTIGQYKVDKNGKRVALTTAPKVDVDIWVGDSRTVGLGQTKGISSKCIAKVGEGYNWYVATAESQLKEKLKKKPTARVVINLGVNDITNYAKYIKRYKTLISAYPKAKFYFMSVNPIDTKKYTAGYVTTTQIKTFNKKLKEAFPTQYIDAYNNVKFSTVDGLHYTSDTYKKIYNYVVSKIS